MKNGQGEYSFHDGSVYKGHFEEGAMNGVGKISWENGDWYEGEFKNNIINGNGKYYINQKKAYYEGNY